LCLCFSFPGLAFDLEPHAMEPSIQFADDALRPVRSDAGHDIGGVVRLRSKASLRVGRSSSVDVAKVAELEDVQDEDAGLRDERDFKRSQVRGSKGEGGCSWGTHVARLIMLAGGSRSAYRRYSC